ncbi:hypothetical protein ACJX0J_025245, partial [Zea mays]
IVETQENTKDIETYQRYKYPTVSKHREISSLLLFRGIYDSWIGVMLGENGLGKTTFIRMLDEEMQQLRKEMEQMRQHMQMMQSQNMYMWMHQQTYGSGVPQQGVTPTPPANPLSSHGDASQ